MFAAYDPSESRKNSTLCSAKNRKNDSLSESGKSLKLTTREELKDGPKDAMKNTKTLRSSLESLESVNEKMTPVS
jgi:hypothetical protein